VTDEQLHRFLFRLLKTNNVIELHGALAYALKGPHPMVREPADPAADFSRQVATELIADAKAIAAPGGPPSFPPRR
jgi:hypothetical protein